MIGLQDLPSPGPSPGRAISTPQQNGGAVSVRERTAQAVEYYNSNVLRARLNAGLSAPRASYNDRHHHHLSRRQCIAQDSLYRSNSSLELQDHQHTNIGPSSPILRREYGSHGSIDVIANDRPPAGPITGTSESFFAMLQDYRPAVLGVIGADQRSPGPSEYLRGKLDMPDGANSSDDPNQNLSATSPKLRLKLHRFWGGNMPNSAQKPQRQATNSQNMTQNTVDDSVVPSNSVNTNTSTDIEERTRRRAFAHYDCQSLTANLGYAAKLRSLLLARRRNTTTGASAASMLTRSSTPESQDADELGDDLSNDLLESCPFFRNEVGGEPERCVSLTRATQNHKTNYNGTAHRPPLAYGVSVLEFPVGDTHWKRATCPYQKLPRPIESVDHGALYYRRFFCGQDHQNWFGMDDNLGPVAVSIKREKLPENAPNNHQYQYRLVIRTSELLTLRGAILEEAIPNLKTSSNNKSLNVKEVLEYVAPEIQLNCLRLGIQSSQTEDQLLKLDEQGLTSHYKVGIMYCRANQSTEEEMYNNEDAGPAFLEFLDCIGQTVKLKGFDKYKAGLDNKTDSTGLYSVYAQYQDCEVMFHVSTMLPFTPNNRQQLLRKRHIGNDIVTIVFQEPGALPFTPKNIRSQFQHVFIVVRAINPCTENTHYSIAVSRSKEVPVFGPPIKDGAIYPKSKTFADFLLAKVVNAENAAHRSEKFSTMATRTRQEYLKDLATNYSTTAVIETGQKFSIFSKKKEKTRLNYGSYLIDSCHRGAICWQVILDDSGLSTLVECFLGISTDSIVLIEERSRQIVFVAPCTAILGWATQTNSLRIYHHQGECVTIHIREGNGERDELLEIMDRLKAVTNGHIAQELTLRRNPLGQLGFHVQPDGIITQVENMGLAWQAGLRQGARLVEICKVAVSTLSHDQMVDLLKTSILVTVTVIPPNQDGSPRKGCTLQNCRYTGNLEGDYENLSNEDGLKSPKKNAQLQQPVSGHRRRYDRSFSPPRSSNSSGYGTGSSSKSFGHDSRFPVNNEGTMTSSSSGHSSDERWYELLENTDYESTGLKHTPPPLPNRLLNMTPKRQNDISLSNSNVNCQNMPNNHQNPTTHIHNNINGNSNNNNSSNSNNNPHNKIQISHSLPLPHANFSLPLSISDYEHRYAKTANIEYIVRQPKYDENYGETASLVDKNLLPSEDELSNSSGNLSPRLKRSNKARGGQLTPSSGSSRNHSPRTINETRLRPGVTPRSNRNSANLSSSTLQEDLMKLINPDYMEENCVADRDIEKGLRGHVNGEPNFNNQKNENFYNDNQNYSEILPRSNSPERLKQPENYISDRDNYGEISVPRNSSSDRLNSLSDRVRSNENFHTDRLVRNSSSDHLTDRSRSNKENGIIDRNYEMLPQYGSAEKLNCTTDRNRNTSSERLTDRARSNKESNYSRQEPYSVDNYGEILPQNSSERLNCISDRERPKNCFPGSDSRNYVIDRVRSTDTCFIDRAKNEPVYIDRLNEPHIINNRSRSRENLNSLTLNSPIQEVIFTMARPATVISNPSTASSPAPSENKSRDERGSSPRVNNKDGDWQIETATREILKISDTLEGIADASLHSNVSTSTSVPELQNHLSELETRVSLETRRRKSLEDEVKRLREENKRLQDESQAAAHQLRRFTEWFFQTIDKQ